MTDTATGDALPWAPVPMETVHALADFLAARHAEAETALTSLGSTPLHYEVREALERVASGLYRGLGSSGAAVIQTEVTRFGIWTARADRTWWGMVAVARLHKLHPALPDAVRSFLEGEEWR